MPKDLYVVTKFIFAGSAREAIDKEGKSEVNEVWIDKDWRESQMESLLNGKNKSVGFDK